MSVLDAAHETLLTLLRDLARGPRAADTRFDFSPTTIGAFLRRAKLPAADAIVPPRIAGVSMRPYFKAPAQVKRVRDALIAEGTIAPAERNRADVVTAWRFVLPAPAPAPAPPTTPTAPRTLADVLRPYCIDAEDVENAVDEVSAALGKGVQSALTRVVPRIRWTFAEKQTQSYGFDSRKHGDLEGATLYGTVTYPEYAVLLGTVKLGLHRHWSAGLLAASSYFTERTVATNIEMIPYVPELLLPIAQEALADWQPSFNTDDLEDRMWQTNAAENNSETEYTDRDGEVIETQEGLSAAFRFRFEIDSTAPPPTVTLDENGFLLVRVDARVRVRLSRIYDPWDKPREYGGFR